MHEPTSTKRAPALGIPHRASAGRSAARFLPLLAALSLSACAASMNISLRNDLSAGVTVRVELPDEVASKIGQLRGDPPGAELPLIDPALVRAGAEDNGVRVVEARPLGDRVFRGIFEVADLADLGRRSLGAVSVSSSAKGGSLSVGIDRSNAAELFALFPGIDPYLIEALSPPALDGSDLTMAEYREMLGALLGTKSLPALDAAEVDLVVELPGTPVAAGTAGFTLSGRSAKASIKLLDLLVLETPITLKVSWGI
ncbi:MAG: hypothetical protein JXA15_02800 [Spirochaetales bacterium]|nr:hypothetical protein [Spirochaetales bacterium]